MEVKTILVVDDDPTNIQVINELLIGAMGHSYSVMNANNGDLAIRIASKVLPNVIISDWEMPGMSGIELTRTLKSDPATRDIPVIIASGIMLTSADLDIALAAGAIDYIRKPVDQIELLARVRSAVETGAYISELRDKNRIISEQENEMLQQRIAQLQMDLEFKQRELTSNISFLTQLEHEKTTIVNDLKRLNPYLNAEGKNQLKQFTERFTKSANSQSLLELENRFDEINFAFYEALSKQAPDITKTEKLLCAYLKMNLSPSEIAEITQKNTNAINVSFSRIRSKMNTETNVELKEQLLLLGA